MGSDAVNGGLIGEKQRLVRTYQHSSILKTIYDSMMYSRSGEELAHEDAERPEVDRAVVALVEDDLRGDVFGRAAKRPRLAPHRDPLRKAKVHHLRRILV